MNPIKEIVFKFHRYIFVSFVKSSEGIVGLRDFKKWFESMERLRKREGVGKSNC